MTDKLSSSPDKGTFQRKRYEQIAENATENTDEAIENALDTLSIFNMLRQQRVELEQSDEFKKNNLEYDLRSTEWIVEKVKKSESYAQNLYAAMCNNEFQKIDNWCILSDQTWSCSWRYSGGIVADMKGEGDYIDYYCSGIRGDSIDKTSEEFNDLPEDRKRYIIEVEKYVPESIVTDDIRADLRKLGWVVLDNDN